jgi:hypothetical protein
MTLYRPVHSLITQSLFCCVPHNYLYAAAGT